MAELAVKAVELHKKGYNCAQAVACAFCEKMGRDEKEVFEIMEGFGLGMGGMQATCGAVSGIAAVIGMDNSDGNLAEPKTKGKTYKALKGYVKKFEEKNGSIVCKDLKGVETGTVLRSCPGCVQDAAELIEEYFNSKGE